MGRPGYLIRSGELGLQLGQDVVVVHRSARNRYRTISTQRIGEGLYLLLDPDNFDRLDAHLEVEPESLYLGPKSCRRSLSHGQPECSSLSPILCDQRAVVCWPHTGAAFRPGRLRSVASARPRSGWSGPSRLPSSQCVAFAAVHRPGFASAWLAGMPGPEPQRYGPPERHRAAQPPPDY